MDIRDMPILHSVLEARYRRRFFSSRGMGSWYGDFDSFEAALASAPNGSPIGYDTEGTETLYDNFFRVDAKDFPVLFWLEKVLKHGNRVFDFGGNVGHMCLAYRALLSEGASLDWEVYDVPTTVNEGTKRVRERGIERLSFTTDFSRASGAHVLLAAGALQYERQPLPQLIEALEVKPRHVVVNMLPTLPDRATITLQNIGPAFCAYRIDARTTLSEGLKAIGYEPLGSWENPEGRTRVPFSDRAQRITWVGHCFRLRTDVK
jgi:putative methyltransferase (TIGR04325 family)